MTIDLNKVQFGYDDAETEAKRGFLDKVYLKTLFFERVKKAEKTLVIGRKGAGKSALCLSLMQALKKEQKNHLLLTPESSPFLYKGEEFKLNTTGNDDYSYVFSWKYSLLVEIAKNIVSFIDDEKNNLENNDIKKNLDYIKRFLYSNNELELPPIRKFLSYINIINRFSASFNGFNIKFEKENNTQQEKSIKLLKTFEFKVSELLKNIDNIDITVLIDKIDEAWSSKSNSKDIITGLIIAATELNNQLAKIVILLFLRTDIYDSLQYAQSDKLRLLEERITWNEKNLEELIVTRGKISSERNLDDKSISWNSFFADEVKGINSFNYILDRTLRRPREMIQFCKLSLNIAQEKKEYKISEETILKAEIQYSEWKVIDLTNEFKVQFGFLRDLLLIFQGFKPHFTRSTFENKYNEAKKKLLKQYPEIESYSTNTILQVFFQIGILGAIIDGKNSFIYDDRRLILPHYTNIAIHPAFHVNLGIIQSKDAGSIRNTKISGSYLVGDMQVGGNIIDIIDIKYSTDERLNNLIEIIKSQMDKISTKAREHNPLSHHEIIDYSQNLITYIDKIKTSDLIKNYEKNEIIQCVLNTTNIIFQGRSGNNKDDGWILFKINYNKITSNILSRLKNDSLNLHDLIKELDDLEKTLQIVFDKSFSLNIE